VRKSENVVGKGARLGGVWAVVRVKRYPRFNRNISGKQINKYKYKYKHSILLRIQRIVVRVDKKGIKDRNFNINVGTK
jgi:hypothetical protein